MPFGESNAERKIGGKEAPKDIEAIKKEIKEKYPEEFKRIEQNIENQRVYTEKVKNKYPGYDNLKNYLQKEAGFRELLIDDVEGTGISTLQLFNSILIEEKYFPKLEKIKEFAPKFFAEAIRHVFGNIKEKIAGHEMEHSKGSALKTAQKNTGSRF